MAMIDLVGMKFGNLTIVSFDHREPKGKRGYYYYWKCQCKCGNFIVAKKDMIQRGFIKCENCEINLVGKTFGYLTIIGKSEEKYRKHNSPHWICKCVCSREIILRTSDLIRPDDTKVNRNAVRTSCGKCFIAKSRKPFDETIVGKKYGLLTIKGFVDKPEGSNKRATYVMCDCDCGKKDIIVTTYVLIHGEKTSCGCLRNGLNATDSPFNTLYGAYVIRCNKRNIVFDLDKQIFKDLTSQNCFYCGIEPIQICKGTRADYIYNGIDRIDSSKGYILENCVPCCKICNHAKTDLSKKDFLDWVKRVCRNLDLLKI